MPMDIGMFADLIILGLLLFATIRGWFVGFVIKIGQVVALIAAGVCAGMLGKFGKMAVSTYVIGPLFYAISFIVLLILFMHLVNLLKVVDKIPVIGTLNKLGGLVAGFLAEFIFLYFVGMILFGILPMSMWNQLGLTKEVIADTVLLKLFVP